MGGRGAIRGALSFDGVNDWVTVADAAGLDLTTGMTLEAWVKPSAINGWETVVMKQATGGLAYAMYADNNGEDVGDPRRPSVSIRQGSTTYFTTGAAQLGVNVWAHLAATYDGSMLRNYVNGSLASSLSRTGPINTSTGPLRMGGNSLWSEWFNGLIDEVRVYDTALTQAQIQADMATPVGGGGGAQLADRPAAVPARTSSTLTDELVAPALTAAFGQWVVAGLPAERLPSPDSFRVVIADLPGNSLGFTDVPSSQIWLDHDAAGFGWVPASGGLDLTTVVSHEVGHLLGIEALDPDPSRPIDLMDQVLSPGELRAPSNLDVRLALAADGILVAAGALSAAGQAPIGPTVDLTRIEQFAGESVSVLCIEPRPEATDPVLIETGWTTRLDPTAVGPVSALISWSDERPDKEWWTSEPLTADAGPDRE